MHKMAEVECWYKKNIINTPIKKCAFTNRCKLKCRTMLPLLLVAHRVFSLKSGSVWAFSCLKIYTACTLRLPRIKDDTLHAYILYTHASRHGRHLSNDMSNRSERDGLSCVKYRECLVATMLLLLLLVKQTADWKCNRFSRAFVVCIYAARKGRFGWRRERGSTIATESNSKI